MKKLISVLMTIVLTLTALSCTTVFADSEISDEYTALEKAIINTLSKMYSNRDDIVLTSFNQLSDNTAIYSFDFAGAARSASPEQTIIGKYKYRYADINQTYYFANSESYTLNSAYTSGMISDEQLDEIAEILDFETVSEDDVFLKIREEIANKSGKINPDDITFFGVEFLSNNDVLFAYRIENTGSPCVMNQYFIGQYNYFVDYAEERFVYTKSEVNRISYAYNNGLIDDDELDEIAGILGFAKLDDIYSEIKNAVAKDTGIITADDIVLSGVEILNNGDYIFAFKADKIEQPVISRDYNIYNIGKYRYYGGDWEERYLYSGSEIKNINTAYNEGIIDDAELDEIARTISRYFDVYTDSSDANGDGKTDVDDVTHIQKLLAGITDNVSSSFAVVDVNCDCSLTIDDATLIQKQLAGFEVQ